ncbi:hypothetical protein [Streptomyces sp. TM32]|uniref:hypothetical protein n=1 Tax=Streptomyces sp. TM32 TaxID=1652669 RepID=UPI0013873508|nr:hypothetical protein [Streptomyces sp. TM32]
MLQRMSGVFIGAFFGTVLVVAHAHAPLNPVLGNALRVLAVLIFAGLLTLARRAGRRGRPAADGPEAPGADWLQGKFAFVVGAEVALLIGGNVALREGGAPQETSVAWIALIVGLHVLALAALRKRRGLAVPGAALTALGVTGLGMAATSAVVWVPFVSGVLSGTALLGGCAYAITHTYRSAARPQDHDREKQDRERLGTSVRP